MNAPDEYLPGDDCILVDSPCLAEHGRAYVGEDVKVWHRMPDGLVPPMFRVHPAGSPGGIYWVHLSDGRRVRVCSHCLRRKPIDAVSFEGIAALTGWSPPKERVQ